MIAQIAEWYRKRKQFNQTYRELNQLTNHELKDLGLERSMLTRVALEATYGREKF